MTILVNARTERAMARLMAVRGGVEALNTSVASSNRMTPLGQRHLSSLMKFGNQLQWTGRMLQYNFTLPILAAGAAATAFAMDQEKAMTHVAKVYGDTEAAAKQFRREMGLGKKAANELAESYKMQELEALDAAFTQISTHYGVQKKEVLEVAGAWAAAGASGRDLAESVNTTMKAIIIGDMNAMDATNALISIQAQYNLNTKQLMGTLANLNSVENQTGAQMGDLITGFEKAAGVARSAGIETNQLAAYMAALVPATGSAASAGNALKTIISRLMSPTKEAKQVMEAMGLEVTAMSWQSSTAAERLQIMAKEFNNLESGAQNAASSVIASRWQVNRFEVLMRELINTNGYYQKALKASEDQGASFRRMQDELNTVLESSPRKMQRMWVMLQNASVEIIQPLIPHIIYLVQQVAQLAQAFANLNPETQKLVMFLVLALAAIGPVIRYMGALWTLVGVLGFGIGHLAGAFLGLATAIGGGVLTPLKMLGTVMMGAIGAISSGVMVLVGGFASMMTGAFGRVSAFTIRWWSVQIGVWRAGMALQLLNVKLFTLSFTRFWVATSLMTPSIWGRMWVVMKTITVTALFVQGAALGKFATFWTRLWTLTATVTTNVWGRMATMILLLSKNLFKTLGALMMRVIPILLGPWGIAALAITGVLYALRDDISKIFNNVKNYLSGSSVSIEGIFTNLSNSILRAFYSLPQGVQDTMVAIVNVVREAALAVYDWFSYINPWAHHSPSLVENVETGMSAVMKSFSSLRGIKQYTSAAYAEIKKFGELTANIGVNAAAQQQKDDRKTIKKAGGNGAALASFDRLAAMANKLRPILDSLQGKIDKQQNVVDRWQKKLDKANADLEKQQNILDRLQNKLDKYQAKLDEANNQLDYFANAPLVGMRDMENQIFANTMAQNKLRLEMMQMEDVVGTFDDVKAKMDGINAAQELMRGQQSALRAAGAGSEILSQYDNEINKLEEQKDVYEDTFEKLNSMQQALEALQREAERLDLVKSLRFDEFTHQIEQAADRTKELSFEEIMAGIAGANAQIDKYTPLVEKATEAVNQQQDAVDKAEAARDRIADRLDQEEQKLQNIKDRYDQVAEAINGIETAMSNVVNDAQKLVDALDKADKAKDKAKGKGAGEGYISPGLQNFLDAGSAGFPDPGGKGIPPRTDWSNQADDIKKFTEDLALDTSKLFEDLNPFKPLKDKALAAWEWIKNKAEFYSGEVGKFFSAAFDGVGGSGAGELLGKVKGFLVPVGEFITGVFKDLGEFIYHAWELIGPDVMKIGRGIWDGLKIVWETVGPKIGEFKEIFGPLGKSIQNLWTAAKPILALIAGGFLLMAEILLQVVSNIIEPVFKTIARVVGGIVDVVLGVIQVLTGLFTGDWSLMWSGIVNIVEGTWSIIWGIISGAAGVIWGIVSGIVTGIYDFFVWLYDVLVGHSVVPDMINGIIDVFHKMSDLAQWVWNNVLKPVYDFFVDLWNKIGPEIGKWWERIKAGWEILKTLGSWFWTNVLKPVWDWITDLWDKAKNELGQWRARIEAAWSILLTLGQWVWNNVFKPVYDTVTGLWTTYVSPELGKWRDRIEGVWDNLTRLGGWVGSNVMDPIKNAFTTGWNAIADWFTKHADILTDPVNTVINVAINAVNALIKGLNKVADILPGVDWDISTIDTLAAGGPIRSRKANRGFMTQGARAIVGEGKPNYPEFVIPTDPTYRNRAKGLMAMAAAKMGIATGVNRRGAMGDSVQDFATVARDNPKAAAGGIPEFGIGGWLSSAWHGASNLVNQIADLPRDAVGAVMNPLLDEGRKQVHKIGWTPIESPPLYAIDQLEKWVKGTQNDLDTEITNAIAQSGGGPAIDKALEWARSQVGKPYVWGAVGPDGYDCSGFMSALTNVILGKSPHSRVGSTATFPWPGFSSGAQPNGFTIGSSFNYGGSGVGHMAGTLGGVNVESAGGVGVRVGAGARGYNDPGFTYAAHLKAKYGGILEHRTGGTNVKVGEAGRDEAIIPLPNDWRSNGFGRGETHIHIAELVLPNITSGEDVDLMLQNLENLAED